ncbi:MAG: hypothetical protein K5853_06305 [Lachnospiraceae bacterium]|nr:hypothetical protein [Lachnospiraceae bacterium]
MNINFINNVATAYSTMSATSAGASKNKADATDPAGTPKSSGTDSYVKSDEAKAAESKGTDRSAIVNQMKADMESQTQQLLEIVRKSISGQGKAIGNADEMWRFLADGDFTVDAATKKQAQADIAEDGYWGVEKTSDRILDFAKALSGGDTSKAEKLVEAFKQGFEEATKAWGKELPDISKRTYDAVLEKFEAWKNGEDTTSEKTS